MNKKLWILFLTFMKIGLFTFGGGYAMIPLIQQEIVEKRKWCTNDDILAITAIAESTPGPIAVNIATFVGYRIFGFKGALLATIGIVLPSLIIIIAISYTLETFKQLVIVRYAFFGIRAGILALIIKAMWLMYRQCPKHFFSYCIIGLSFCAAVFLHMNIIMIIIGCASLGLLYHLLIIKNKRL